jgi:LytR cell envelope-related transcriptional attenuator
VESIATSDALVRPWRTATILVSAVAVLELFLLLAVGAMTLGKPLLDTLQGSTTHAAQPAKKANRTAQRATPATAPRAPLAAPKLPRTETSVLVLNGNGIAGAAAAESQQLQRKGYIVADVGNAGRTDYARSLVMYRPGYKPEASRLAHDLRVKIVTPLDGLRKRDLMGAHVAVVMGSH